MSRLGRRSFLSGTAAAGLLAACGGGADPTTSQAVGTSGDGSGAGDAAESSLALQVAQLFSNDPVIGAMDQQRVPFALIGGDGVLRGDHAPAMVRTVDPDGAVIDEQAVRARVAAHTHAAEDPGHAHPDSFRYYAPRIDFASPGRHQLVIDAPEGSGRLPVDVYEPTALALPHRGTTFPSLVTPTVEQAAGVDTICTRSPACDFHRRSVDAVLGAGEPCVLLIATPAYCQTQFCGPVLDVLIEAAPGYRPSMSKSGPTRPKSAATSPIQPSGRRPRSASWD